jgi:plastocyanin
MRQRLAGSLLLTLGLLLLGGAVAVGAKAGGGCHSPDSIRATDGAGTTVNIESCAFGPTITRVPVGETVSFVNADVAPHNVIGLGTAWGTTDDLATGDRFSHTFAAAGIYPYACTLHAGMTGAIAVGESETVLANATSPLAATAAATDAGFPIGIVLAGAGGLAIGALGAGILGRRRAPGD